MTPFLLHTGSPPPLHDDGTVLRAVRVALLKAICLPHPVQVVPVSATLDAPLPRRGIAPAPGYPLAAAAGAAAAAAIATGAAAAAAIAIVVVIWA